MMKIKNMLLAIKRHKRGLFGNSFGDNELYYRQQIYKECLYYRQKRGDEDAVF